MPSFIYLFIYLQNNFKTSKERNQPGFEEEERQGLFILEANARTNEKD